MSVYDARFLMAVRRSEETESEPVSVYCGDGLVYFLLDDGDELVFDEEELQQALFAADFASLVRLAERLLATDYPADVFTGTSGDSGALFVAKLREALGTLQSEAA